MEKTFKEFVDKKSREAKRQLKTIKKLLEKNGLTVDDCMDKDDPYIFLNSSDDRLSFKGIRIYKIGEMIAYRVQKEKDTHPYGRAYLLDVTGMFNDLMSENGDEKKSGIRVIKGIVGEFQRFFEKSLEAERDIKFKGSGSDIEPSDDDGDVLAKPDTIDYGTMISSRV